MKQIGLTQFDETGRRIRPFGFIIWRENESTYPLFHDEADIDTDKETFEELMKYDGLNKFSYYTEGDSND